MAKSKPLPSIDDHKEQGQLPIRTNSLYLSESSVNIYLTYDQAVQVATNILKKAEMVKEHEEMVVQVWAKKGSSKLNFGINEVVKKGKRRAWD